MSRRDLAKFWLAFGILALFLSGFLSILVTGAKMPFVKPFLGNLEWIRWFLVIHVNLATLVWFTAIPVGISHLVQTGPHEESDHNEIVMAFCGLGLSVFGVLLMLSAWPGEGVTPLLSNYIPVVTHRRHDLGLICYFLGVLINYVTPSMMLPRLRTEGPWAASRFGLWVGGLYFVLAAGTLGFAYWMLDHSRFLSPLAYYETGMWGGGHLLQHSSSVFLVVTWVQLLRLSIGDRSPWSRERLFPIFAALSIPALIVPVLLLEHPTSGFYRHGFTLMMMWGLAPTLLVFMIQTVRRVGFRELVSFRDPNRCALLGSFLLVILGCVFGALIRGPDLRVPGHYHATIGAITVSFFVVAFRALFQETPKLLRLGVPLYVFGQVLFSSGMFTAGFFGIGRKTYGAEHVLSHTGQYVGFAMLGIGGLIALAGGLCFGFAVWQRIPRQALLGKARDFVRGESQWLKH